MNKRKDICAPGCDDQLPVFSRVGRGIQGDGFYVDVADPDTTNETHLEGFRYDAASKEWSSEWVSENINGGELRYQYNLRPFTIPQTFTITFIYRRPGRPEWSWTTPAIPYIWTIDDDGNKQDPDGIVGSGVATLFIKKTTESSWTEKLIYPSGTTRDDYNAPNAEEAWTVNLSFGIGGDVDVPNIEDIAKILGITVEDIRNIIKGNDIVIDNLTVDNIVDFIKKADDRLSDHIHADMGFNGKNHGSEGAFGGYDTVKAYIDGMIAKSVGDLTDHIHTDMGFNDPDHPSSGAFGGYDTVKIYIDQKIQDLTTAVNQTLSDIVNKIYGGGTINDDGSISWPNTDKIAVGNMNLYGGSSLENHIRTDADGENDYRVQ